MNLGLDMNLSSIIADIATIAVLLIFALVCAKRGFCKCIMPIVVTVLSFVTAIFGSIALEKPVAELIYPLVSNKIDGKLVEMAEGQSGFLGAIVSQIDLSKGVNKIAQAVTDEFVHIGLFIIILLLSIIIFSLLGKIATKMADLPLIKSLDGFLGFIYGLLQGFVLIFLAIKVCDILNVDFFAKYSAGTHILLWIFNL